MPGESGLGDSGPADLGPAVFRRAARRFVPWKNGGGETAEIVVAPPGAGLDEFDWRISTAIVGTSGPFSVFAGVDRVLTVLEGGTMVLHLPGRRQRLGPGDAPFSFAGDKACEAELEGAALLDLNVMVCRPLRAVVTRGAVVLPDGGGIAAFVLIMEAVPALGLERFDLVDLERAGPELRDGVVGRDGIVVRIEAAGG